jgi:hypothetical protein
MDEDDLQVLLETEAVSGRNWDRDMDRTETETQTQAHREERDRQRVKDRHSETP